MLINNSINFLKSEENKKLQLEGKGYTAFDISEVLGIALCKDKTEIIKDLVGL